MRAAFLPQLVGPVSQGSTGPPEAPRIGGNQ